MRQTCIFSGSSHPELVEGICERLGQKPAIADLKKFSNGETSVEIKTSVRDQDVFIVQSGSAKINDNVMELLIMINASVVPYFPYSRQSKKKSHRGAITARMLANLMNVAGVNHVITMDLHASQMQGFFKCPVDNLVAEPLLAKWLKRNVADWQETVVVSKNPGGTRRVTSMADALNLSFGIVTTDWRRPHTGLNSMMNSVILESNGVDGSVDGRANYGTQDDRTTSPEPRHSHSSDHDFAHHSTSHSSTHSQQHSPMHWSNRSRAGSNLAPGTRNRLVNGSADPPSSPLARSTRIDSLDSTDGSARPELSLRRISTVPGVATPRKDEDGYEDPAGSEDEDELARDVVTGRLIHGHIVDDDATSPCASTTSEIYPRLTNGHRHSSEDDPPDTMTQSFMSTASHRTNGVHGLGGTGDATASDEEEEDAIQNPEIETTITLVGNVRGRPVLIIDDIIDKAGSWIAAAETVRKRGGATKVYCMATHGLFGGDSLRELDECDEIDAIVVTNAFPIPAEKKIGVKKLIEIDVSGLLAEAIRRNHHGESISQLYQHYD
ncbi:hypothetical protein B0A48_11904 [Cryoendolithus antarcticus]|uniref:ribose-phosphate diphosphokinase n=1 Tax=Cryoendolithus antarcticus TaxID=1507870 RepID=A0A1V8STG1_9PEZI|nr:hypothetical protein B0A48_11904 [Cryoendolithus antarcticus]